MMRVTNRIIYLITAPICFWGFISYLVYVVLSFDNTVCYGINFYTSYIEFFPVFLLCIVGCGSHIIIGLTAFYQQDKQWRLQ